MMVLLQKWNIRVRTKNSSGGVITFNISDNHIQNVLRKLADLEFKDVWEVTICEVAQPAQQGATGGLKDWGKGLEEIKTQD